MFRGFLIGLIILILTPTQLSGQQQNGQFWLGFEADWDLKKDWFFYINPEYYTLYTGGDKWYEAALITGIGYSPSPKFTFWGGFYTSYILQTENEDTYEFRPRVGARWNISRPTNKIYVKLQAEYEWRFFWSLTSNNYSNSNRIRVRPDMLMSLFKESTLEDNNFCLRLYGEYFQNLDNRIEERFWNRYGTALGLYYRHNSKWRYELRYLLQGSNNTIEETRPSTISHIMYLYITYVIP